MNSIESPGLSGDQESFVQIAPRRNYSSTAISILSSNIKLEWKDLVYEVDHRDLSILNLGRNLCPQTRSSSRHQENDVHGLHRVLLNSLNGFIQTGQLTALIGPSGSGKTTLLECISGRKSRTKITGTIQVKCMSDQQKSSDHVRLSYMAHSDTTMMNLTVEETILFAFKLRERTANRRIFNEQCSATKSKHLAHKLIQQFGLERCLKLMVGKCSNGQQKRLSIALELIHCPTILLLDEPTSGLDSVSCLQCVCLLKELAENPDYPMAIMVSIHQPTSFLLKHFHQVYALSKDGQCLYNGPQSQLVDHLASVDLQCPNYYNPADFLIEIATGNLGQNAIKRLVMSSQPNIDQQQQQQQQSPQDVKILTIEKIIEQSRMGESQFLLKPKTSFHHTYLLWSRCILLQFRDPFDSILRLAGTGVILLLVWAFLKDSHIGKFDSCYHSHLNMIVESLNGTNTSINQIDLPTLKHSFNCSFLFFITMYLAFISTFPIILTLPIEIHVIRRELYHGWYGLSIYFLAKNLANLILTIFIPIILGVTAFWITDQPFEPTWRFNYSIMVLILIAIVGDGCGQMISALFVHRVNEAIIFAAITQLGLVLFSGMFIPTTDLPPSILYSLYISHYRLCFQSLIIIRYGFDTCIREPPAISLKSLDRLLQNDTLEALECLRNRSEPSIAFMERVEEMFDRFEPENPSMAMESFDLVDDDLYPNLYLLACYALVYRLLAYLILYRRTR